MNPTSPLYGAMNKERKPFTYTPGGLDLSEIKSERMAQRLLRNAMDQGVPVQPTPHLQSPPTPTTLNVPNFNCLPVQVFPTFPLPANPKSLLKTRSNQQKEPCLQDISNSEQLTTNIKQFGSKQCFENNNKNMPTYNESSNENKNNDQSLPLYEYNTAPIVRSYPCYETSEYADVTSPKLDVRAGKEVKLQEDKGHYKYDCINIEDNKRSFEYESSTASISDTSKKPFLKSTYTMEKNMPETVEEIMDTENTQNEVKVVKKQAETENGNVEAQNGDTNVEAAVTIKLPGKKSAAKTETKVEVVKNVRSDGSTEEVKTTTTKTTIDGKTEITTKTETTIIPKEEEYEEEEYVEEEEEEEEEEELENAVVKETAELNKNQKENNVEEDSEVDNDLKQELKDNISSQEETSETITTKRVTVSESEQNQENFEEEDEEVEEEELEEEEKDDVENKNEDQIESNIIDKKEESEEDADDEEEDKVDIRSEKMEEAKEEDNLQENKVLETEKEVVEKMESVDVNETIKEIGENQLEENIKKDEEEEKVNNIKKETVIDEQSAKSIPQENTISTEENKEEIVIEVQVLKPNLQTTEDFKCENDVKTTLPPERNLPFREPSAPLEKVEDVEIKPIGEIISKSRTENTEIITTSIDKPITGLSTQTAYNRIENIVTVNKTTKTLDHAYEQNAPLGIPTVKTYYAPTADRLTTSPYPPVYTPEPQTERRHSLLLDRLSVDRQMPPAEIYQNNYQTYEQNQWTQEPQSEVLTVSNVKPSTITKNQQWYQQTRKEEVSYDTAPSLNVLTQEWSTQPQQRQTPLPSQTQSQYQPQTQTSYIDKQDTFRSTLNNSSTYQQNTYPSYTPKPTSWVGTNTSSPKTVPNINKPIQPSQFSYVEKEPSEIYQTPPQPYSSSYIPPPWEQDSNYVTENLNKTYYTPPSPPSNKFTASTTPTWTPKPTSKFTKPKPTSYIPPAPNQSFVKPVTLADQPKLPGRKTYYSEYERRYISVPESTYIPTENKFQVQPDPSPQYYYDNNEPKETVEHEWRKELREFSEKTQSQTEQTTVKPPWEEDPKYYVPTVTTEYTPTPTWSQTLRPSSWRDRSFESEFGRSKELSRTNTIGRGRPQSSYVKSGISAPVPERPRGVSVDRYNPNVYKSPVPSEYPPVQSHTLDPSVGAKTYHNPSVPAYHSRASAEPREQSAAFPQSRHYNEARAAPLQSRSFKYLQWITGTED